MHGAKKDSAPAPCAVPREEICAHEFYHTYHGHSSAHLNALLRCLPHAHRIFLVGDSSLDNKYWLLSGGPKSTVPACNGYEGILSPPRSFPDIAHHLNFLLSAQRLPYVAINAAVEESALCERVSPRLLEQDRLVAGAARPGDVLVACAGGNDVVLKPSLALIASLAALLACASEASLAAGTARGLAHFIDLFQAQYGDYLRRLCAGSPSLVIVCMVYYPQHALPGVTSWADTSLSLLGYTRSPETLQRIMRAVFVHAVSKIAPPTPATRIVPLALFDVLDASSPEDYVQRVEPSALGGEKMARAILRAMLESQGGGAAGPPPEGADQHAILP